MSSIATTIDRKYLLWGSLFAFGGAAALAYVLYPKEKKHLYQDVDKQEDVSADTDEEAEDESEPLIKNRDILVVGLANVGKSSILASLCGNKQEDFQPTDGFNVVSFLDPQGIRLNLVELGGTEKNRQYWRHFYTKKHMVVMVIDASNEETLSQSSLLLKEMLGEENLRGLPFIVVANKQDKSGSIDGDSLMIKLKLKNLDPELRKRNIYHVQTQTPVDGIHKGIAELKHLISNCK